MPDRMGGDFTWQVQSIWSIPWSRLTFTLLRCGAYSFLVGTPHDTPKLKMNHLRSGTSDVMVKV